MREVSPGDIIFSFVNTRITAIGIVQTYCWESPKPSEFGEAGQNWENGGWKAKIAFTQLSNRCGLRTTPAGAPAKSVFPTPRVHARLPAATGVGCLGIARGTLGHPGVSAGGTWNVVASDTLRYCTKSDLDDTVTA